MAKPRWATGWKGTVAIPPRTIMEAPDRPEFQGVVRTVSRGVLKATEALDRVLAAGTASTERKPTLSLLEASSTPVFEVDNATSGVLTFKSSDGQFTGFAITAEKHSLGLKPLPEGTWTASVSVNGVWSNPVSITVTGPGGAVLRTDSAAVLQTDGSKLPRVA
jgi:hypothetical protein